MATYNRQGEIRECRLRNHVRRYSILGESLRAMDAGARMVFAPCIRPSTIAKLDYPFGSIFTRNGL